MEISRTLERLENKNNKMQAVSSMHQTLSVKIGKYKNKEDV